MAFNRNTYRANRAKKAAYAYLEKARDIKRRAAIGDAYDWELPRIAHLAKVARLEMRTSIFWRNFNRD